MDGEPPETVDVRARLIGPFEIEGVDVATLHSRKARTLLKVLALAGGRPVSVDRLVECLWSGAPPARAEREVAVNASRARSLVGADAIERSDAGYRLRVGWCDITALAEIDDEARRRITAGDHVAARAAAGAGLALVRGTPLCDEADPWWAEVDIAGVRRRIASLRGVSARAALALGSFSTAAADAELVLSGDPLDEEALRVLMAAQAAAGRPGSALAAYAEMRTRLAEELGVDPAPETEALHSAILLERPIPGIPPVDGPRPLVSSTHHRDVGRHDDEVPGRAAELATLERALTRLTHRPVVVSLDGEPGSGKTTVLDAFARRARRAGAIVLRASCDERGIDLPLEPLAVALGSELDTRGRAERARVLGTDAHVVGSLLGLTDEAPSSLPGPLAAPDALRLMTFTAIGRVLARLADGAPLVLLLDDAHRAGDATVAWLRHVVRRRDPLMLVVVARRSGERSTAPVIEVTEIVPLVPLDLDAAARIVGAERAPELLERSGGNALFLVELAGIQPGADLPASIRASVAGQLADGDVAATLRTAAVLGHDVDLDLLAGVLHRSALAVLDHLEVGLELDLLRERDGRLGFRHALVAEALAIEVSATRQVLVHRDAARVLSERPDADPLLVAHHARLARDDAVAAAALARGASRAAARFDLGEAERLLTDAIDLAPSGALLLQRGRVRLARTDLDGADQDAIAAVATEGAPALELRAWVARYRHDMETALRIGTEAAARAEDPTTRASALLAVAFAHRGRGELAEAEHDLVTAIATEGSADLGARGWLGVLRVHQGRPAEALDLLEPAIGAEVDAIHGFWVEHTLQMTAHAYGLIGRVAEAGALLDRLDRELDRRGSRARYAGLVENYRSWILRNLADPSGIDVATRAVELTAIPELRMQSLLDLADAHLRAGALDAAASRLDAADETMHIRWFQNRWRGEARLGLLRAHLCLAHHDPDRAAGEAEQVATAAAARGDERYLVLARLARARAAAVQGQRVDVDTVGTDLARLPHVAALEAWWTAAEVGRDLGLDRWRAQAEERVEALAVNLGPDGAAFRRRAGRWLDAR